MKQNNMIDLTTYFAQSTVVTPEEHNREVAQKIVRGVGKAFEVTATATIALCVCACTLLFFTML